MTRRLALLLLLPAAPALGDALTITKATTVVSDQVSTTNPKALPGSTVDYTVLVNNPNGALTPVKGEVVTEPIAAGVSLCVGDLGAAGSGPVEFADGSLLGTGLLSSGLSYSYGGAASTTDDLEFSNGTSWTYVPVADANGCDAAVRAIRVTLRGTHAAGTSYRLRYRVRVR